MPFRLCRTRLCCRKWITQTALITTHQGASPCTTSFIETQMATYTQQLWYSSIQSPTGIRSQWSARLGHRTSMRENLRTARNIQQSSVSFSHKDMMVKAGMSFSVVTFYCWVKFKHSKLSLNFFLVCTLLFCNVFFVIHNVQWHSEYILNLVSLRWFSWSLLVCIVIIMIWEFLLINKTFNIRYMWYDCDFFILCLYSCECEI